MASNLFRELVDQPTNLWTADRLEWLTIAELKELCHLIGIGHCKTHKQYYIDSIVKISAVQRIVRPYWGQLEDEVTTEQISALAQAYKSKELRSMCRRVGTYAPSTKHGMAAALIGWNRQCVRLGRLAYERALEEERSRRVVQLRLELF